MKKIAFVVFLISLNFLVFGQTQNRPLGANYAALGNVGVVGSDVWSVFHNQAGLAWLTDLNIGVHFENKFGLKELNHSALAVNLPVKFGTFGFHFSNFGYSKFNEKKMGLAYAKKLFEKVAAGIQLDYFTTSIYDQYGSGGLFTAEMGLQMELVPNLILGAHVFNPMRSKYDTYDQELLSPSLKLGISYLFSEQVFVGIEVENNFVQGTIFKTGIEYQVIENLKLRAGMNTQPAGYHFGMGYVFKQISADLAFSHHQVLGYSTNVSLQYRIFKK